MVKEINELSWDVDEITYRKLEAISYSTISTFCRDGLKGLQYLGVSKDSASLRYGSLVDTLLTEEHNINNKFKIIDFKIPSDLILKILTRIAENTKYTINDLNKIDEKTLITCINEIGYGADNWKDQTKINKIIDEGNQYFHLLVSNTDKIILSVIDLNFAKQSVKILKNNEFTKYLFEDNPFTKCKTYFQLKFKHIYKGVLLKCMFDIIYIDYENKIIYPIDLKTTSKNESEFEDSFLSWRYDIQATMYSFILREIISQDDYFKDFTVAPFKFLVINKYNNTPLFWKYNESVNFEQNYIIKDNKRLIPWYEVVEDINRHLKEKQFLYNYEALNNEGVMNIKCLINNE